MQMYAQTLEASLFWKILLAIPPVVMMSKIFTESRRRAKVKNVRRESLKLAEEEGIYEELKKIAREHFIWCRNERVSKIPTLCLFLNCQYKNYSTDIPRGCSKCQLFQLTDQNKDWITAKRTHDFATVNPKKEENEINNSKLA